MGDWPTMVINLLKAFGESPVNQREKWVVSLMNTHIRSVCKVSICPFFFFLNKTVFFTDGP